PCGVNGRGGRGILADAIVGLVLSGGLAVLVASLFWDGRARANSAGTVRIAPPPPPRTVTPPSSPLSPVRQAGWVGTARPGNVGIALVAMDDAHAETAALVFDLGLRQPCSVLLVDAYDNFSAPLPARTL